MLNDSETREIVEALVERIVEAGETPTFTSSDGRNHYGPTAIRVFTSTATLAQLEDARRQLADGEAALLSKERRRRRWEEEDARRAAGPSERELREAAELEERARAAAEYSRTVPGLLERLLATNEEILTELRKKA